MRRLRFSPVKFCWILLLPCSSVRFRSVSCGTHPNAAPRWSTAMIWTNELLELGRRSDFPIFHFRFLTFSCFDLSPHRAPNSVYIRFRAKLTRQNSNAIMNRTKGASLHTMLKKFFTNFLPANRALSNFFA